MGPEFPVSRQFRRIGVARTGRSPGKLPESMRTNPSPPSSLSVAHPLQNSPRVSALLRRFLEDEEGQTATEYMLLISVIVVAVVAAAYLFVPTFQQGVQKLAEDVSTIL